MMDANALPAGPTMRQKILVVNDSPEFLEFMRELLTLEGGYEVATLDQSEGVIEQVTAVPPDLIVLDLVFRGGRSGHEAAVALAAAAHTAHIPVIFCTTLSERDVPPAARALTEAQGLPVIHKPFNVEDMLQTIDAVLARKR